MKKKISRFALSILAGIGGLILVLMAWAYWYTAGEEFRSLLREKALAAVRGSVNGEVTFESLSGSIWREIHVSNVSVMQDGMRALFIPRLSVQVSLIRQAVSFLFSSNLHVAKIELEAPVLRLVKGEDGKWNVASLLKEPEDPGKKREMTVYLDRIKIDKGRIEATLPDGGSARIAAVALDGSLTLPPDGMRADLADLQFHLSAEGYPETAWDGSFFYVMSGVSAVVVVRRVVIRSGVYFILF
jgi:uncharacterized protein involved in outer membrane biogenesis